MVLVKRIQKCVVVPLSTCSPLLHHHLLSPIILTRDTAIKGLQLSFWTFFCVFSVINKYTYFTCSGYAHKYLHMLLCSSGV